MPTLYRLRTDITWEDAIANWKEKKVVLSGTHSTITPHHPNLLSLFWYSFFALADLPMKRPLVKSKPKGYWLKRENRRDYLIDFAKQMGFDPSKPENWANVTNAQIRARKVSLYLKRFVGTLRN